MLHALDIGAILVAIAVAVPTLTVSLQCLIGAVAHAPALPISANSRARPLTVVLVPAHNEELIIGDTIGSLRGQLGAGDRVLVVADNCTDATAEIARSAGAEVVERDMPALRGKGYALHFAVRTLDPDPPDVVVVVDADCRLSPGAIDMLCGSAVAAGRPVQAKYVMRAPHGAAPHLAVAEFAFLVRNFIRPRAMAALGLPCHLMGTGMAFPWPVLRDAPLASGNIVEDLQLSLDLALAGRPATYCERAEVWSAFPAAYEAQGSQRARWEGGHLATLFRLGPRCFARGVLSLNVPAGALALDVMVPPLSLLLAILFAGTLFCAAAAAATGAPLPLLALLGVDCLFAVALVAALLRLRREGFDPRSLRYVPAYLASKIPIYRTILAGAPRHWMRTPRDPH